VAATMADNPLLNDNNNDGFGGGNDIFVYTGGEQRVPDDVKRVQIAENVDTILAETFRDREELIAVEGHDKIKKIEECAFIGCYRLRLVAKMRGVVEIKQYAFSSCWELSDIDFTKLEIIGEGAFLNCRSLRSINMPSIRRVGQCAFMRCVQLTDAVFGKDLERIEENIFYECTALGQIVIPLKYGLIIRNNTFNRCSNFSRVDAVAGGIHKTISSLHLESWRNEMHGEIERINQTLPNTPDYKAVAIQQWIERVLQRIEHYRTKHLILLKEAMTLLELALWKAKLLNEADEKKCNVNVVTKKAKIDVQSARKEHRVTCGASIVIKNVLPFLALK
jgi:hypothetical protein